MEKCSVCGVEFELNDEVVGTVVGAVSSNDGDSLEIDVVEKITYKHASC